MLLLYKPCIICIKTLIGLLCFAFNFDHMRLAIITTLWG